MAESAAATWFARERVRFFVRFGHPFFLAVLFHAMGPLQHRRATRRRTGELDVAAAFSPTFGLRAACFSPGIRDSKRNGYSKTLLEHIARTTSKSTSTKHTRLNMASDPKLFPRLWF